MGKWDVKDRASEFNKRRMNEEQIKNRAKHNSNKTKNGVNTRPSVTNGSQTHRYACTQRLTYLHTPQRR